MGLISHQANDITRFLEILDGLSFDHPDYGVKGFGWGDGMRAEIVIDEVPVYSDAIDAKGEHYEKLGVLKREDFNWFFYEETN